MRRIALLGVWVAATAVAITVAWGGVQLVARQVVDPVPLTVTEAAGPAGDGTAAARTPRTPGTTTGPAEPAAEAETRTYRLEGGTVTVAFSPSEVRVVQATPRSGFTRKVEPEGSGIKIEFESEAHRSRLDAWWDAGPRTESREDRRG